MLFEIWRVSQPEKPLGVCLFTEVMSGLIRGGERVWPGIIQLPLQADILREAQLNRPLYDKISQLYLMLAAIS